MRDLDDGLGEVLEAPNMKLTTDVCDIVAHALERAEAADVAA
jgi:hypothetical protein